MDLGIAGRACAVTGASRGIGKATACQLAAEGANVVLVARSEDGLAETAETCREAGEAHGTRVEVLAIDVRDTDAGEKVALACQGRYGAIDVLVNAAGVARQIPIVDVGEDEWQAQLDLHVLAAARLMRAAAPRMAERGWGRIVNVTSSAGKRPAQWNIAYSASKAAQLSLSRAYADAYAKDGVLINAVAPGAVATELWTAPGGLADQAAQLRGATREQALADTAARIPLGRLGEADEVASVIVFLCSERASNVTGAAWSIDGGTFQSIV